MLSKKARELLREVGRETDAHGCYMVGPVVLEQDRADLEIFRLGRRAAVPILRSLVRRGLIEQGPEPHTFVITAAGRAAAARNPMGG